MANAAIRLGLAGQPQAMVENLEYPRLYARFTSLIDAGHSDVDWRLLTLVADAMLLGSVEPLPDFGF